MTATGVLWRKALDVCWGVQDCLIGGSAGPQADEIRVESYDECREKLVPWHSPSRVSRISLPISKHWQRARSICSRLWFATVAFPQILSLSIVLRGS